MKCILRFSGFLAVLLFHTVSGNRAYAEFKAKNVVIIVGDQFRHDESLGEATHQYIPHLWKDLIPNGSLCVTFYGNPSYMVLVHLATLTGSWRDIRRIEPNDFPDQPTMFEYFRKGLGKDQKSCYFITSKHEFDYMHFSNHEDYGEDFAPTVEFTKEKNNDNELVEKLVAYMKANNPRLVFVILGGLHSFNKKKRPDEVEEYRKNLKGMDARIYKIWQTIQSDPHYKDKTNMIFLNDHGDLIDHEDCDDECKRYLVMVAIGPDIKKKYVTENKWRQVNICPTVGAILGFPTPFVTKKAKVMKDILVK